MLILLRKNYLLMVKMILLCQNSVLSMMGAFAEFELELRRERQREGIAEAKKKRCI